MKEVKGDIWKLAHFFRDAIVIPTNVGYTKAGKNVMGRGLAAQAARRFPRLPEEYGDTCMRFGAQTPVVMERYTGIGGARWLVLFPTKPLRESAPQMSWQGKASLERIEISLRQLATLHAPVKGGTIWVPLVGCGNGNLHREPVRQLMDTHLTQPWFVRVRPPNG